MTYLGEKGYQPVVAYGAEEDLLLADEFQDGNMPASMDLLLVLKEAIATLPKSVRLVRVRSDSAAYGHELLDWCRAKIPGRPRIEFVISVPMTEELKATVEALPEEAWRPLRKVTDERLVVGRKEWAEVEFVPSGPSRKKMMEPDRYLAIRVRPAQGELLGDGQAYHYHAICSNMGSGDGEHLWRWQRERCGLVEKVHEVMKNDLAIGVLPSKYFFVNAAWFRINAWTYNVLSVMKRKALPQSWWPWRLKALRFNLLNIAGKIIEPSRQLLLKISRPYPHFLVYKKAREKLFLFFSSA